MRDEARERKRRKERKKTSEHNPLHSTSNLIRSNCNSRYWPFLIERDKVLTFLKWARQRERKLRIHYIQTFESQKQSAKCDYNHNWRFSEEPRLGITNISTFQASGSRLRIPYLSSSPISRFSLKLFIASIFKITSVRLSALVEQHFKNNESPFCFLLKNLQSFWHWNCFHFFFLCQNTTSLWPIAESKKESICFFCGCYDSTDEKFLQYVFFFLSFFTTEVWFPGEREYLVVRV